MTVRHDGYGGFRWSETPDENDRHGYASFEYHAIIPEDKWQECRAILKEVRDWIRWSQESDDVSWTLDDEEAFIARIEKVLGVPK